MDLGISGRRAAVAAASAGLGLGTARALAAEGVRVAICGRREDVLLDAVASITADGGDATGIVADVGTAGGATDFVEQAKEALGGVDILVTNAGGPGGGGFAGTAFEDYEAALRLNLLSTVAMCQAAVADMRAAGWGRVVGITSVSVRQPIPSLILSNTARAGATGFLKTLALEVAADGVTVNTIQPGTHDTDRIRHLWGDDVTGAAASVPVGRLGDAEDFGAAAAFLCSEQAKFITGASLNVDGGAYRGLQ
jgi:3-oxoacyl-[acyl-carrier protein] reductase